MKTSWGPALENSVPGHVCGSGKPSSPAVRNTLCDYQKHGAQDPRKHSIQRSRKTFLMRSGASSAFGTPDSGGVCWVLINGEQQAPGGWGLPIGGFCQFPGCSYTHIAVFKLSQSYHGTQNWRRTPTIALTSPRMSQLPDLWLPRGRMPPRPWRWRTLSHACGQSLVTWFTASFSKPIISAWRLKGHERQ
jgi:hypothetical protein